MITEEKIKELAVKNHTTELNIHREYAQHLFLSYFYQQPESNKIYFKGGTALKFIYGSPRFSEDLDFSTPTVTFNNIEDIIQNSLLELERIGAQTDISESKETTGGYLALIEMKFGRDILTLKMEISFRDKDSTGEVFTVNNDFIPSYTLLCLKKEKLINQKIRALLSRRKPRDFYDLYFILRANLLPAKEKISMPKILEILTETPISFKKELEIYLPKSHWLILKNFKQTLEREINTNI